MDISIWFGIISIIVTLAIGIGGIFFALWHQGRGAPKLKITPGETEDGRRADGVRLKYLHLMVTNVPEKHRWVPQKTAYSCHGNVTFSSTDNSFKSNPMPIRWDGNPEPLKDIIINGEIKQILERSLLRLSRYVDIPPEEKEQITIALRIYGEDCAFGWTGESYQYGYHHPDFTLLPGDYIATVYITTGDHKISQDFKFTNPIRYEEFDLIREPASAST